MREKTRKRQRGNVLMGRQRGLCSVAREALLYAVKVVEGWGCNIGLTPDPEESIVTDLRFLNWARTIAGMRTIGSGLDNWTWVPFNLP